MSNADYAGRAAERGKAGIGQKIKGTERERILKTQMMANPNKAEES